MKRGLVALALAGWLLQSPGTAPAVPTTHPEAIPAAVGRGTLEKAFCLGCGAAIVAAGGLTWGGLLLVSFYHADAVLSCGYVCYTAFAAT